MIIKVMTVLLAVTVGTSLGTALGQKADCGSDAFSKAVDRAAAALRQHSADTQPRILAGIRQLKVRNGWRDEEEGERARELLADAETDALDQKAAQLLATMDRLSEEGGQKPGDCAKLSELRAVGDAGGVKDQRLVAAVAIGRRLAAGLHSGDVGAGAGQHLRDRLTQSAAGRRAGQHLAGDDRLPRLVPL